jgi:hypothetical protein
MTLDVFCGTSFYRVVQVLPSSRCAPLVSPSTFVCLAPCTRPALQFRVFCLSTPFSFRTTRRHAAPCSFLLPAVSLVFSPLQFVRGTLYLPTAQGRALPLGCCSRLKALFKPRISLHVNASARESLIFELFFNE